MHVGQALLDAARATGAPSVFVVGTGKNVGKTVTLRAIYDAATGLGIRAGLTSIGRDGEAADIGDAASKPRLFLRRGTYLATARGVLPQSPAATIADLSRLQTAAGPLVYARVEHDANYELVGPPTAHGVREAVNTLLRFTEYAIIDGAVDRVAALAGGNDAVIVAAGASAAATMEEAIDDARALVARLRVSQYDGSAPMLRVEGALTAAHCAALITANETRTIVVRDPTQLILSGKSALRALDRLTIRCERPLRVVAVTVASIGRNHSFEPRSFVRSVARATGLPAYDVYTGECAA